MNILYVFVKKLTLYFEINGQYLNRNRVFSSRHVGSQKDKPYPVLMQRKCTKTERLQSTSDNAAIFFVHIVTPK